MKSALAAIAKNKNKIIGWLILLTLVPAVFVFFLMPFIPTSDPTTILFAIACFIVVGLVSVWIDNRYTAKNGNTPRGYV